MARRTNVWTMKTSDTKFCNVPVTHPSSPYRVPRIQLLFKLSESRVRLRKHAIHHAKYTEQALLTW